MENYIIFYRLNTVKTQAVDPSTIQFWNFWAKGHSTKVSNFSSISLLKILGCATNRDSLLLTTLRYCHLYHFSKLILIAKRIRKIQTLMDYYQEELDVSQVKNL